MKELDAKEFDARREKCSQAIRNVLDFLKTVAEHAGAVRLMPEILRASDRRGVNIN